MGYEIPEDVRQDVYQRDRYRCAHCGKTQQQHQRETVGDRRLHLHHIWPRAAGGKNTKRNLITLCRSCHAQIESTAQTILRAYSGTEARYRIRWETFKRVRTEHPLSVVWLKIVRTRYQRFVGERPTG
ncbi:HNH endonuclease [Natronorubrum texcoconense]|uniref:HNH endonuclease n=1 Tax=Natronorubrum texcoconense TaxID=1095776 RepID=UPI000B7CD283